MDTFITALYGLAEHCRYGDLHDEMIRDHIVVGIRNVALSEKLQLKADLTLKEAVTQVRQSEAIKPQQPLLRSGSKMKCDTPVGAVNRGKTWHRPKPGSKSRQNTRATPEIQSGSSSACTRCGKCPAHDRRHCPAKDVTCRKCGKRGYYQVVCRSASKLTPILTILMSFSVPWEILLIVLIRKPDRSDPRGQSPETLRPR